MEITNEEYEDTLDRFEEELTKLIDNMGLAEIAETSSFVLANHLVTDFNTLVDTFITHNNYKT